MSLSARVGFTPLSERVPPAEMVALLDQLYTRFDREAERLGVEKIRTIGDGYMAVAGCPEPHADHAAATATLALAIERIVAEFRTTTGHAIDIRVGLNSGPVVAGVVGQHKYHYDVWGDAVNTAARMESHGEPGRIQITGATRAMLPEGRYEVACRGTIDVKGKGVMETWWLAGRVA